jgi:ubiquinone/menaquinone biosynthesis C-methylase UbiE
LIDEYSNSYGKNSKKDARRISYHIRLTELGKILGENEFILDVGCATGDYSIDLTNSGINAICCDVNLESIRVLHDKCQSMPAIIADGRFLPFRNNSFSAVVAMNCLRYFQNPDNAISEFHRVLKPRGRVIIFDHNGICLDTLFFKKDVAQYFRPKEIAKLTKMNGFKDQKMKMILLPPPFFSIRLANSFVNIGHFLDKSMITKIYPEFILTATKNG